MIDTAENVMETEEEQQQNVQDEVKETTPVDETAYTPQKQMIDFERANARKARAELETVTEAYVQATAKLSQLEQELAQLQTKKDEEQDRLEEMDPDLVDEKVSKNIQLLERSLKDKEQRISEIMRKVEAYEKQQADFEAKRRNEEVKKSVFETVEDFLATTGIADSAKYRNEASTLADTLVDTGEVNQPKNFPEAVKLMTKCYFQIRKDKEKKGSPKVSVDTGKAGSVGLTSQNKSSGIKPGRLSDVKAQMLKDKSWKG